MTPPDLKDDSAALRVTKRPDPVRVRFATVDGVCETLEGSVRYQAGDAIVTGTRNEQWPIRGDLFRDSYEPEAGVPMGQDGTYRKRPSVTLARRLDAAAEVPVGWQDDPLHANPGDWLLHYADGSQGLIRDDIFRETYGPADGETRWPP